MTQRMDETTEEYRQRQARESDLLHERAQRMFDRAAEPRDLYADFMSLDHDRGVLRLCFACSRPDSAPRDPLGDPISIPVARISIPFQLFQYFYEDWLKSDTGRYALAQHKKPE